MHIPSTSCASFVFPSGGQACPLCRPLSATDPLYAARASRYVCGCEGTTFSVNGKACTSLSKKSKSLLTGVIDVTQFRFYSLSDFFDFVRVFGGDYNRTDKRYRTEPID